MKQTRLTVLTVLTIGLLACNGLAQTNSTATNVQTIGEMTSLVSQWLADYQPGSSNWLNSSVQIRMGVATPPRNVEDVTTVGLVDAQYNIGKHFELDAAITYGPGSTTIYSADLNVGWRKAMGNLEFALGIGGGWSWACENAYARVFGRVSYQFNPLGLPHVGAFIEPSLHQDFQGSGGSLVHEDKPSLGIRGGIVWLF